MYNAIVDTGTPNFAWPAALPRTCSKDALFLAVKSWATGAKSQELAEILNIPLQSVRRYTKHPGWHSIVQQLRPILDEEVEARLGRMTRLALAELEDRLEHGNKVVDRKTNTEYRAPLTASDLSSIAATLFDKKTAARKIVDGIPDEPTDIKKSLDDIADILRRHNTFRPQQHKTIDITPDASDATPSGAAV